MEYMPYPEFNFNNDACQTISSIKILQYELQGKQIEDDVRLRLDTQGPEKGTIDLYMNRAMLQYIFAQGILNNIANVVDASFDISRRYFVNEEQVQDIIKNNEIDVKDYSEIFIWYNIKISQKGSDQNLIRIDISYKYQVNGDKKPRIPLYTFKKSQPKSLIIDFKKAFELIQFSSTFAH